MKQLLSICMFLFAVLCCSAKPLVYVSIPPQAWLVRSLAGDLLEVKTLLPANANPHTFEPSVRQMKDIAAADLYFTIGMPFELNLVPRMKRLNDSVTWSAMDQNISKRHMAHDHGNSRCSEAHGKDPHIWLSPKRFAQMATNAFVSLSARYPEKKVQLSRSLEKTVAEIQAADQLLRKKSQAAKVKFWMIYHPSLDYLTEEYGFKSLVIEQEGKAPSARYLANLIRTAKKTGIKNVLVSPQQNVRCSTYVAEQIGGKTVLVDPLEEDWPAMMRKMAGLMK